MENSMLKRVFALWLLSFALLNGAFAQRKIVYVEPFTMTREVPTDIANAVRSKVYHRIADMGRVELVDGESMDLNAARKAGAFLLVRGDLTGMKVEIITGKKEGDDKFEAKMQGTLQLISVSDGGVLSSTGLTGQGSSFIKLPTISRQNRNYRREVRRLEDEAHDKAIDEAINSCGIFITDMIDENVKIEVQITGITEIKKNEVRGVTINKGSFDGVSDGQRFTVSTVTKTGNYPVVTKIAEIRVKNQPTPDAATCKVTSGKAELKKAMDANLTLQIISRKAKFFD